MIAERLEPIVTAGGHQAMFACRPDTNDAALAHGIIEEREYHLPTDLTGWAIDVGAHIGLVAVALALDNPDLRVVAVEALPENVELLRRNVELNGLSDRVFVESAAAASEGEYLTDATVDIVYGWSHVEGMPDGYVADSRFIGGMVSANDSSSVVSCPVVSLGSIMRKYAIDDLDLLKIDCEGCEWFFLTSPDIARVARIIGEMHTGKNGNATRLRELLAGFDVTMDDSLSVALFLAVRE